jgi:dTDP-glucose pyrophosphorylase
VNSHYQKHIISCDQSLLGALKVLNTFGISDAFTLLIVNDTRSMVGTLTDGDIRRHLINGIQLNEPISTIMHRQFHYLSADVILVEEIHEYKAKGIELIPILDKERHIVDIVNLKTQKSFLPIDAILMAGGKGERLRPLTEKTPKPLLKVGDKAIIDYNIESLIEYGIKHISVTVNYLHEQIEAHFKSPKAGVNVSCVCEPQYLGTIGSVKFVDKFHNDTVLVMNSDLFTNINYEDFYLHFKEHDADMSVAAVPYSVSVPYGIFDLNGRNIQGVQEKPTYNYYANAGIYLIKRSLIDMIPTDTFYNATDFMEMLIREQMKVVRFPITGYWIDIGKHEDYNKAMEIAKHL